MCGWGESSAGAEAAEYRGGPGCDGSEIRTPNVDRLAGRGVRFTQFDNAAWRCPTRAPLTGDDLREVAGREFAEDCAGGGGQLGELWGGLGECEQHAVPAVEALGAPGRVSHEPGHLIDVMATCLDMSGAKYPAEFNENQVAAMVPWGELPKPLA